MVLIMRTHLAQLSSLLLFVCCSLWPLLEGGLFVSLMCIMLFCMEFWRRRFICVGPQFLLILHVLSISAALSRLYMDSSMLLVRGMHVLALSFGLMGSFHPQLIHPYSFFN